MLEVDASDRPLRGVMHTAGVLDDSLLAQQNWARFEKVLGSKVLRAWKLHERADDRDLDFHVLFSSMASVLGVPGQGNYASANAFMDGLVHFRVRAGLSAMSINWGCGAKLACQFA